MDTLTIRILIASATPDIYRDLDGRQIGQGTIKIVARASSSEETLQKVSDLKPDLVLIDADSCEFDAIATAHQTRHQEVPTGVMITSENEDPAALRRAIRAGVLEYLVKPVEIGAIAESIQEIIEHRPVSAVGGMAESAEEIGGRTIALVSACSRVGKSTISVNIGSVLQKELGKKVALVDFLFGDISTMLSLKPENGIANLIPVVDELDIGLLREYATTHEATGMDVYVGSPQPQFMQFPVFEPEFISRVLNLLRENYDYVIADFPLLVGSLLSILSEVDQVIVVATNWDLLTLRSTKALLRVLTGHCCAPEKVKLVLNRSGAKGVILTSQDIAKAFEFPIWAEIANDGKAVMQSLNMGCPVVLRHPNNTVSQHLRALARKVADMPEETGPARKRHPFGR